jgi:hypothetical protein
LLHLPKTRANRQIEASPSSVPCDPLSAEKAATVPLTLRLNR